jgi:hypothetical protein
MLSIYIIIVVEGRVKKLAEERDEKIILKNVLMSQICVINCFRFEFDTRRR